LSESDARQWTYAEFDAAVNRTANMLLANGIAKGDVVSLLLPNSPEYIIAYFACWKIGALAGPVNSLLKPEEIEWVVGNSEAKLMLVGSDYASSIAPDRSVPPALAGGGDFISLDVDSVCSAAPPANAGGTDLGAPLLHFTTGGSIVTFVSVS